MDYNDKIDASAAVKDTPVETPPPPPPVDSTVKAVVSGDRLSAQIIITRPENGGMEVTDQMIRDALDAQKIVHGIDDQMIGNLVASPLYNDPVDIARGDDPQNGTNGSYTLRFAADKSLQPRERSDGTVDYRELDIVENVSAGQVLCDIALPTDGTPGISVRGETIQQVRGKPVAALCGANTQLSADGTAVISKIDGQVDFKGKKINVNETFIIKDNVDNTTGNIKAAGNIQIGGSVYPKFTVEAGGNIEVRGTVEWATLRAGGNIVLRGGCTGSTLTCNGDLTGKFIENCNISVRGSARAEYLMSSNIRCGKTLSVVGQIAKIVGGSYMAGEDIVARIIGSPMGAPTLLELGSDPAFIDRQQELRREIPELEKKLQSLQSLITLFQQLDALGRLTEDKKEQLHKAQFSLTSGTEELENNRRELEEISELIRKKGFGRIICQGTVFPGTKITIGAEKLTVDDMLHNTSLRLSPNNDGIVQGPAR